MKKNGIYEHVGKKVKEIRRKEKITQEGLGEILGLTRTSIINIETGKHHITIEKLYVLCAVFKLDYAFFLPEVNYVDLSLNTVEVKIVKVKTKKRFSKVSI